MNTQTVNCAVTLQEQAKEMLHELRLPVHRLGYKQLCIGIPRFALDDTQSLSKELYPYLAARFGSSDWRTAESAIRDVILSAWANRDPAVWDTYFSDLAKAPSNKQFIAALAERLQ